MSSLQFDLWSVRNQQCMRKQPPHLACSTCLQPLSLSVSQWGLSLSPVLCQAGRLVLWEQTKGWFSSGPVSCFLNRQHGSLGRRHQTWLDQRKLALSAWLTAVHAVVDALKTTEPRRTNLLCHTAAFKPSLFSTKKEDIEFYYMQKLSCFTLQVKAGIFFYYTTRTDCLAAIHCAPLTLRSTLPTNHETVWTPTSHFTGRCRSPSVFFNFSTSHTQTCLTAAYTLSCLL